MASSSHSVWARIAWRNVWRNRRRTAVTVGALAIGFIASSVMIGLSGGLIAQMIDNGTTLVTGQIQVYQDGFKPERMLYSTIGGRDGTDVDALVRAIASQPGVRAASPRVYAGGLLSSGEETIGGLLMGVDTELEPGVSRLLGALERGALPRAGVREVLIGSETSDRLRVDVGSDLVLVAPAADGSMGNDVYTVSGVYRTGDAMLDGAYALLHIRTLQQLVALETGRVHEVAASVGDPWSAESVAAAIETGVRESGLDVRAEGWTEFRPELAEYALLAASYNWIIVFVVFVMAIFGVANTMLMATWERRREFAVIRALGSPGAGVVRSVVIEALVLGVFALAIGAALGLPLMYWWSVAPPSLAWLIGDYTLAGAVIEANLRVALTPEGPLLSAAGLLATVLLAGLYPAFRSARQPPADILAGAD